jgi:hypothetical protein
MGRLFRAWGLLLVAGLACLPGGCKRDVLRRQAVSGTVTFKGQPLAAGKIEFSPVDGQATLVAGAIENGRYAIPAAKGLSPGTYKVLVNAPEGGRGGPAGAPGGDLGPPPKELIPPRYNAQTELRATVEEGGRNVFAFDLK